MITDEKHPIPLDAYADPHLSYVVEPLTISKGSGITQVVRLLY